MHYRYTTIASGNSKGTSRYCLLQCKLSCNTALTNTCFEYIRYIRCSDNVLVGTKLCEYLINSNEMINLQVTIYTRFIGHPRYIGALLKKIHKGNFKHLELNKSFLNA